MGLKELYEETSEIYNLINRANEELKQPVISPPIYSATENFIKKLPINTVNAVKKEASVLVKEGQKVLKSGDPKKIIGLGLTFGAAVVLGTLLDVGGEAFEDIKDNVVVRKEANKQLEEYRKELAVKRSLIIDEQQKLIAEKAYLKNSMKEQKAEIDRRIKNMAEIIEECNKKLRDNG